MTPSETESSFYAEERFWQAIKIIKNLQQKLDDLSPEGMREEQVVEWLKKRGYKVEKQ